MLFIYLITFISSAELYTATCPENQALNLYDRSCYDIQNCNGFSRVYNATDTWCGTNVCDGDKCYQTSSGFSSFKASTRDRCVYSGFQDMESCQQLINDWSLNHFASSNQINLINCPNCKFHSDFITAVRYGRSYEIEADRNIPSDFRFSSILTFILARFDYNGTFLGFKELTLDLNRCGEKSDISQIWRMFGTNFYSDCNFNLPVMNASYPNEFYDLYLLYQEQGKQQLIDVPVLIRNHGRNSNSDPANYELFRRFFLKFSNSSQITFAENISIQIQIDPSNSHRIKVPILIIRYNPATYNSNEYPDYANIKYDKTTSVMKEFHFSVVYLRNLDSFWKKCLITLIVFLVVTFILIVIKCVIYTKFHKDDGTIILYCFATLLSYLGSAIAFVTFIATFFFLFIFYKFQKEGYLCLPPEKDFNIISFFVWIPFVLLLGSSIIKFFLQIQTKVYIIDWEQPEKGTPLSAWRRLMILNEYNRILKRRSYSMEILLIFVLFLFEGLNLSLLAAPIPRNKLLDVGRTYKVLHFAFTSFLWLIILFVQFAVSYLIFKKLGNPYLNFVDLCATANCSILVMNTLSQGYYIHGRSGNDHCDCDLKKLNENMANESEGNVSLRGLEGNNQVFHVYFENDFADILSGIPDQINQGRNRKSLASSSKDVEEMGNYNSLNKFLCRFFMGQESPKMYEIRPSTWQEILLGWLPSAEKKTILTIRRDFAYRESLLYGIEWTLFLTYLLLFAGIEMETRSAAIAAFVVFLVDKLFIDLFSRKAKRSLAKKSLVDIHYIIS